MSEVTKCMKVRPLHNGEPVVAVKSAHYYSDKATALLFHIKYPLPTPIELSPDAILIGRDDRQKWIVFHYTDFSHTAVCDATRQIAEGIINKSLTR